MSSTDYPTAHRTTSWGAGDRDVDLDEQVDEQDDVAVEQDEVEDDEPGTELEVASSYLTDVQLARVEAIGVARSVLLVSGFLGNTPKLEPWALTYVAEWILKGAEQDADEDGGTDAEQYAPTDGGSTTQ